MRLQTCLKLVALLLAAQFILVGQSMARTNEYIKQSSFGFKTGYRVDQLDWSVGEPTDPVLPNILSELNYEDITIIQGILDGSVDVGNSNYPNFTIHLRGMAGVGKIISGTSQDSDYAGDDRTLEWSRSISDVEDDFTVDFDFALGPKFYLNDEAFYILPMIGYSYHEVNMIATNGVQTVSNQANYDTLVPPLNPAVLPPLGSFFGLHSSYDATMDGYFAGLEIGLAPTGNISVNINGKYHMYDYDALADWNLRTDLDHPVSFHHFGEGTGYSVHVDLLMQLSKEWDLTFSGDYRDWSSDPGNYIWYDNTGTAFFAHFNGSNWESYAGNIGLTYHFH